MIERVEGERWHLRFEEAQRAVAPGQSAVLFCDDLVLGGGRIARDPVPEAA
jgi:tRNA-specific 2-thiouridylase